MIYYAEYHWCEKITVIFLIKILFKDFPVAYYYTFVQFNSLYDALYLKDSIVYGSVVWWYSMECEFHIPMFKFQRVPRLRDVDLGQINFTIA